MLLASRLHYSLLAIDLETTCDVFLQRIGSWLNCSFAASVNRLFSNRQGWLQKFFDYEMKFMQKMQRYVFAVYFPILPCSCGAFRTARIPLLSACVLALSFLQVCLLSIGTSDAGFSPWAWRLLRRCKPSRDFALFATRPANIAFAALTSSAVVA